MQSQNERAVQCTIRLIVSSISVQYLPKSENKKNIRESIIMSEGKYIPVSKNLNIRSSIVIRHRQPLLPNRFALFGGTLSVFESVAIFKFTGELVGKEINNDRAKEPAVLLKSDK